MNTRLPLAIPASVAASGLDPIAYSSRQGRNVRIE